MPWVQNYNPLGNAALSTIVAAFPVVALLGLLALGRLQTWIAAVLSLGIALSVALFAFEMPAPTAFGAALYGGAYGAFPIGWIILNVMFLHALTVKSGRFEALRIQLQQLAPDSRIQLILVAFCFGGFIEGCAGFGAPVAITAAMLIQLGFRPLEASALSLIANTAPVAFGSVGIPITTLAQITGLDVLKLSAMVGRQLPFFSVLIPFWVVWAYDGWKGVREVWPAALISGAVFAVVQFLVSNYHGPWLVDTAAGLASIGALVGLLKLWKPRSSSQSREIERACSPSSPSHPFRAWSPWLILSVFLFIWGLPQIKEWFEGTRSSSQLLSEFRAGASTNSPGFKFSSSFVAPKFLTPGLHLQVVRTSPVVPKPPVGQFSPPEKAEFKLNWLSATGTGIFLSALFSGKLMGFRLREMGVLYLQTILKVRTSLATIVACWPWAM